MKKIKIVEVGPRDGLQNEKKILSTEQKATFIDMLLAAGHQLVEATSFVKADKIPQMGDAKELMQALKKKNVNFKNLAALVPNSFGLKSAIDSGLKEIALFTATSEAFNQKNIHASIDESLATLKLVAEEASRLNIKMRGYISTVFGCPYEGKTSLERLKRVANRLHDFGVYQVSYGDTIGIAHPAQVAEVVTELQQHFDQQQIAMHFHDTRGLACANIFSAYSLGITTFDASAGGLGGCPYAQGASGNVATEDVINMFSSMGLDTGIDFVKHLKAVDYIYKVLGKQEFSKSFRAFSHLI